VSILRATFGSNKPVHSANVALDFNLNLQGVNRLKGPVSFRLSGPFQSPGKGSLPKFDFTLGIHGGTTNVTAGAISTGDKGYLSFQGANYAVTDQQFASFRQGFASAQTGNAKGSHATFASLGVDPSRWLINPVKVGAEQVGGADTVHIRAGLDVGRFLDDVATLLAKANRLGASGVGKLPTAITPIQRLELTRSVKSAQVDVYSGKSDEILRRLSLRMNLDVPPEARSSASGLSSGTIAFDLMLANVNHDQTITAPANAQPLSGLLGSGSALGAAAGAGASPGSSPAPAGAGSSPSSPAPGGTGSGGGGTSTGAGQRYLSCLQKAGQDIAAAQKCSGLIGK